MGHRLMNVRAGVSAGLLARLALAGTLLCTAGAHGQTGSKSRNILTPSGDIVSTNEMKQPSIVVVPDSGKQIKLSIDFAGGMLSDYMDALRKAAGNEPCNLVAMGEGPEPIMPALSMREVSLSTAAAVPAQLHENVQLTVVLGQGDVASVYSYRYAAWGRGPSDRQTQVMSLQSVLDPRPSDPEGVRVSMSSETVLSALDVAAMSAEEDDVAPARIRFHRESQLLFVRGTRRQIEGVEQSLRLLEQDVSARRKSYEALGNARKMKNDIAQMELELKYTAEQLVRAEKEADQMRQRFAQGLISESELSAALNKKTALEANHESIKLKIEQSKMELQLFQPTEGKESSQPASVEGAGAAKK